MAKADIYKITVINFLKHNPKSRASFKKTLIANNFCDDARIRTLSMNSRWLFLNLVLACGNSGGDTVELSSSTLRTMLECNRNIDGALDQLQSLQLVTYEKLALIESKLRITEGKVRKTEVTAEVQAPSSDPPQKPVEIKPPPKPKPDTEGNRRVWDAYREAYQKRYQIEPIRNATVNTQVSNLVKKIGVEDAVKVVQFYLTHNDNFFVKNTHTFGFCLSSAETLRTQMLKGKAITGTAARNFEKSTEAVSQADMFRRLSEQAADT